MKAVGIAMGVCVAICVGAMVLAYTLSRDHSHRYRGFVRMMGFGCRCSGNERGPDNSLRTIAAAQADHHANDRDRNGKADYWRIDVAGLYTFEGSPGKPNKLIDISVAVADANPSSDISQHTVVSAKAGFWYVAVKHEGETTPDLQRYAVLAYPDFMNQSGLPAYIIDEKKVIWKKVLGPGKGIEVFPADPSKAGWQKMEN